MLKHGWRVLRAWLFPLRRMDAWTGRMQSSYLVALAAVPGICAAVTGWLGGRWVLVGVVGTLVVLLVLSLAALWRAIPDPRLAVETSRGLDDHHRFALIMRKEGYGIPNAFISLTAPAAFGWLERMGKDLQGRHRKLNDAEIAWEEGSVPIIGGGEQPTPLDFRATLPPGEHSLRLVVSAHELTHSFTWEGTLSVADTAKWRDERARERRRKHDNLDKLHRRLGATREHLAACVEVGQWSRPADVGPSSSSLYGLDLLGESEQEAVREALVEDDRIRIVYRGKLKAAAARLRAAARDAARARGERLVDDPPGSVFARAQ